MNTLVLNALPALRTILANKLQKSLDFQDIYQETKELEAAILNSIKRIKSGHQVQYVSAIALRLMPSTALSLAHQIASNLHQVNQLTRINQIESIQSKRFEPLDSVQFFPELICQDLKISTASPGWIYLEFSLMGLSAWLQHMASSVLILNSNLELNNTLYDQKKDTSTRRFIILHSYARCSSLLRAADAEWRHWRALTQLNLAQSDHVVWQPAEWALLVQLVDTVDDLAVLFSKFGSKSGSESGSNFESDLSSSEHTQLEKHAFALSLMFQTFYANCQIWQSAESLAQRRLVLVLLTQQLLQLILRLLKLPAPDQL